MSYIMGGDKGPHKVMSGNKVVLWHRTQDQPVVCSRG